ncbi:MAG: flagellar hook-associated protein 3 [Candidatus Acidiferrum sp.]|jgi:flagellar hook-associated protein 3 FlgL
MSIRLNPDLLPSLLADIQLSVQNETVASEQLSTGLAVNQLSDNPGAAAALVANANQSAADDQYLQSDAAVQGKLQTADATLSSVVTALDSAISLGTEGASGTVSTANRQAIAAQVQGLITQTLGLANTSYQGAYIFSGTAVNTQPFVQDPATGVVTYAGNAGTTTVPISNGDTVKGNVPGNQLFQNAAGSVFGALQDLSTALTSGNGIGAAVTEVSAALAQVSGGRVVYDNGLNQLTSATSFLNQDQLDLSTQANSLVGVNAAAAVTAFSQATTSEQALLAATAKVLDLPTLFAFLPT